MRFINFTLVMFFMMSAQGFCSQSFGSETFTDESSWYSSFGSDAEESISEDEASHNSSLAQDNTPTVQRNLSQKLDSNSLSDKILNNFLMSCCKNGFLVLNLKLNTGLLEIYQININLMYNIFRDALEKHAQNLQPTILERLIDQINPRQLQEAMEEALNSVMFAGLDDILAIIIQRGIENSLKYYCALELDAYYILID